MTVSNYLVDYIIKLGVTDVFGIPGGVVLDFLYELEKRRPEINAHLSFHEQAAAFSASGYAQVSSSLGVVYATRGPGIANTYTAIADAYYDSTPLLVITAHSYNGERTNRRIEVNQEQDLSELFSPVTKYYRQIETVEEAIIEINKACTTALADRKGPVMLDFNNSIFNKKINTVNYKEEKSINSLEFTSDEVVEALTDAIKVSKRPIFLVGDGVHQSNVEDKILELANKTKIPVLSSRYAQDIMPTSELFFGYIGSHGLRYSNFIFDKSDLIIVLGNQMSFPLKSVTFKKVLENKKIIRFEIDNEEYIRFIPNVDSYNIDIRNLFSTLTKTNLRYTGSNLWLDICNSFKNTLNEYDLSDPILNISKLLQSIPNNFTIVNDVGNNEFWVCRAYSFAKAVHRVLFSKSYGAMGSSLPKAIGIYYKTKRPVVSFNGDQGVQMNIQELQFLVREQLPIVVIVLNNHSSGMIRSRQIKRKDPMFLHTTIDSGYSVPNFEDIASGFGINYMKFSELDNLSDFFVNINKPYIIEVLIDDKFDLSPNILQGDPCQKMDPYLDSEFYNMLDNL